MANLFAAPRQDPAGGRCIVKFKCGRMTHQKLPDGSYQVTAVPARGFLELLTDRQAPNMFRLVWSTRSGDAPPDSNNNVMLVKSEQTLEKVSTGNEADRVFVLTITSTDRRFFFWLQEPDPEGDEAIFKKMRDALGCFETDALNDALIAMGILTDSGAAGGAAGTAAADSGTSAASDEATNGDDAAEGTDADGTTATGGAGDGGGDDEDTKTNDDGEDA